MKTCKKPVAVVKITSSDHTSADKKKRCISPTNKVTTIQFQPIDYFISEATNYRAEEAIQIGLTLLQFFNIVLCMLLRHYQWKDMFSSMFIMQRASKGQSISSHFDHLLPHRAGWNKMLLWNYLLDKVILCYTSIQQVKCYLYKNSQRLCSVDYSKIINYGVQYIKELLQTDDKQYWLRIFCLTITGLSLLLLNLSDIFSVKNFNKLLRIEDNSCDYQSTFDSTTLHNDDISAYHKMYHGHYFVLFILWSEIATNFASDLVTISHFGLTDAIGEIIHKKSFKDFLYIVINKTCFALELTHWLVISHAATLLNEYKYSPTLLSGYNCGSQFETSHRQQKQNTYNKHQLSVTRVLHNWCRSFIKTFYCNPYTSNCCINSWLTILWSREPTILFYSSLYAGTHCDKVYANQHVLFVTILIAAVFVILCWLILKWKNIFLPFPSVKTFQSMIIGKLLNLGSVAHIKCKLFDNIHFYHGIHYCCLVLKRIITSPYTIKFSCTAYDPRPYDSSETWSTVCDNISDSTPAIDLDLDNDDDDNELVICEEETGHDQGVLVHVQQNVPFLFKTCGSDCHDIVGDVKLVVNTTGCVQLSNTAASHQTPNGSKCSCDDDSYDIVSPCECDGFVLDLHAQAEHRNADHQFSRDEKNLVTSSIFSHFPSPDNVVDINISHSAFHQYPCLLIENVRRHNSVNEADKLGLDPCVNIEDDNIKVSPSKEETTCLGHDLDDVKKYSLGSIEGSEDDDSDCDDDNIRYNEKYCGVEECQSFNTNNNELVVCNRVEEIVTPLWSSNNNRDSERLLIGTYTISEAYGCGQVVLSLIGQVVCIHTFDAYRPIGGDHVNKPKVNNNQPSVFEDNVDRSNIDQFNQQPVSLATSHLPSAARTEQRRHQLISSTEDTHIERDGALRDDDAYITPGGQSITTKDAVTIGGAQIIREKPTRLQQIPTVGPQHSALYDTKFGDNLPLSYEEVKQNSKARTTFLQHEVEDRSQQALKQTAVQNDHPLIPQLTNQNAVSNTTTSKPKALPKRSCIVVGSTQYPLTPNLLAHPHMDHFFVKERKEIKPGHFLAKLVLQHHYLIIQNVNDDVNETATAAQQSQAAAIIADSATAERDGAVTKRQHFPMNINRAGYIVFSSDLTRFTGDIKYPLPGRKATAVKLGKGGNGFVFSIFHNSKEYAVKKTVYRPNEIRVHSQLAHVNLVNLEAVLIGEEHEHHKGKFYAFYFMNKLDMDFRTVISTKEHGCLKHLKLQLSDQRNVWEVVMVNIKYVLRSVLRALDYMHNQGLVHRDVKASNILLKMNCQCTKSLMCACPQKYSVKLGDFDSSTTVPGHGLRIEPHQMIRYASVLPLGTMGYRAPEVSMHLVISGPYEVLYTTAVDIWSFGCLLLNILIGKCGPLKQRGEASLLLSVRNQPYSEDLYNQIIKVKELQKYYSDIPELIDLVRKCLQVEVHCRPTAKQLLQLDVLQC